MNSNSETMPTPMPRSTAIQIASRLPISVKGGSSIPAFAAVEVASGDFANRSQLVWGRLGESPKLTNQDVVGQSQYTFIV